MFKDWSADYFAFSGFWRAGNHALHISDPGLQYNMLSWFRELGVAYFYESKEIDERLESIRVLKPEWLTNGIYRLILRVGEENKISAIILLIIF